MLSSSSINPLQPAKASVHPQRTDEGHTADQLLQQRAESLLRNSPYLNGQQLELQSQNGRLTLKGTVGTYFQKQMAQESLKEIDGVVLIDNQLDVTW